MKNQKIILAGGSGFIGMSLANNYKQQNPNYEIYILTRNPRPNKLATEINWDARLEGDWCEILENSDILINLTGKSVDCRYTPKNKDLILTSRVASTLVLGRAIQKTKNPPKLWVNMGSATIYRHSESTPMDEYTGDVGYGFSSEVCKQWEAAFYKNDLPSTRQVYFRTSLVLGKNGGVWQPFKTLTKLGLGGKQGNGKQMVSWIHEKDVFNTIQFIEQNKNLIGTINCTSPNPINNKQLMKTFRKVLKVPFGLCTPSWLLPIGTKIMNTEAELVSKSRYSYPKIMLDAGFEFEFTDIEKTLKAII